MLKKFHSSFQLILRRSYLSEAYKLNREWNSRLNTPLLEKVNADNLYVELCSKFQHKKKITAIDVDIYVNKANDKHVEEATDLLHKLRTTEQASKMLDSTHHAIVRLLMDHPENLIAILNNRLEYGVFLDNHTANLLLDKFITEKNFMLGARIATLQMLQEDFEHPITRYMSLYASYKFLDDMNTFIDLVPPPPPPEDLNAPKQKKKVEEIKIRVRFLRNEFFDDHFDIVKTNHLLGKTFLYLADEVKAVDEVLCNSLRVLGYALYEKFSDGNQFINQSGKNLECYKEVLDKVKALAEKIEGLDANEEGKKYFDALNNISKQKEGEVDKLIEALVKKSTAECESKDIEAQRAMYEKWIKEREETLNEEIRRMQRIKRLEDIEKIQEEMETREKKLWYFDNEDQIKLEIQQKHKVYYPKKWYGKKKNPRTMDENYIPPEV